jgi:AraC family transcriptional regulator
MSFKKTDTPYSVTNHQSMEIIERSSNTVVLSNLSEFYAPVLSKGFAIKYVTEGTELYTLNREQYHVGPNQYLLCNSTKEGSVEIESRKAVKGICINISVELMLQAVASLQQPDTAFPDAELGLFFCSNRFVESQYNAGTTGTGSVLLQLNKYINNHTFNREQLTIELFYLLAEKIIADQLPVFRQLQNLPGIKPATRQELYKRIVRGRELMDTHFTQPLSIELVAKEACMSEYHFYRLFKKMMGTSPHQYILRKRLESGKQLLEQHRLPVSDAAVQCGFSDIYSFSKAFKQAFGITPSSLHRK